MKRISRYENKQAAYSISVVVMLVWGYVFSNKEGLYIIDHLWCRYKLTLCGNWNRSFSMVRKNWRKVVVFFLISMALEVLVFNCRALFSLGAADLHPEYVRIGDTVYVGGADRNSGYMYVGVDCYTQSGDKALVTLVLMLQDEGSSDYYELSQITIYPPVEKSKYLAVHSYGAVEGMQIILIPASNAVAEITEIVYDARVPWFISIPRMLAVFGILCLAWGVRPGSMFYSWRGKLWQRRMAVAALVLANSLFFLIMVRSNPAFLNPIWTYHQQYHQLAVALSRGEVSIDVGNGEILAALLDMENPYDYSQRMQIPGADTVWDICFYQGKFYVYFGIVPVLLFYLPYYLLFHAAFPTWLGVFLAGVGIIGGMFYLLAQIRRKYFPQLSFGYYLLLSLLAGNGMNLFCAMLHADFYYLPILLALCFTLWGMGLILSAAGSWQRQERHVGLRLAAGGLCMALTAGCRPQFLTGSVVLLPMLASLFWEKRKSRQAWARLLALVLPYVIVAAGLMFYNGIRFGSVFDFGANYNLTTNDMTRRGVNLGRLPDGIFMYLFQPVSIKPFFPFAEVTAFYTEYLGNTIKDWTYGGAFWTHPILLALIVMLPVRSMGSVKEELKRKKLYGFLLLCLVMAFTVIVADTEMAGILNRYYTDFLWLLMIPTVLVLFQMLEIHQNSACRKCFVYFILIAGAWGIFFELGMAFRGSGVMNDNAHLYYYIKSLFQ